MILDGKDIEGAAAIDLKMNVIAGSRKAVLIDRTSFVSRIDGAPGARGSGAAIKGRGGKIVFICRQ